MTKYIDGFLIPISDKNLKAYRRMAQEAGKVWRKYGALDYKESVGDDLSPKGVAALFPKMAKLKRGEVLCFSYIVFRSKAHRDKVNAKVMKDPSMDKYKDKPMPFEMKRMAYGGFKVIVDA